MKLSLFTEIYRDHKESRVQEKTEGAKGLLGRGDRQELRASKVNLDLWEWKESEELQEWNESEALWEIKE